MTAEAVGALARHILTAFGGYAVGKGVIDNETMLAAAGAGSTLIAIAWSLFNKRKLTAD